MLKEKIGFIGGGKMGEALCKGIINAKLSEAGNIMVSDVVVERCKLLSKGNWYKDHPVQQRRCILCRCYYISRKAANDGRSA